jgi:hypothetical protein
LPIQPTNKRAIQRNRVSYRLSFCRNQSQNCKAGQHNGVNAFISGGVRINSRQSPLYSLTILNLKQQNAALHRLGKAGATELDIQQPIFTPAFPSPVQAIVLLRSLFPQTTYPDANQDMQA